jgi:hypothetical protein
MRTYEVQVYKQDGDVGLDFIDSFVLGIDQDVNRLNNPSDCEIIETYVSYNYGDNSISSFEELDTVIIGVDWNIENYR